MLIPNFSIPQIQWDGLEFSNHPVQAACALQAHCRPTAHPRYIYFRYVNMDVSYKFSNLINAIVFVTILKPVCVSCRCAAGRLHTLFIYILGMSIWMLIPNLSIPQMQWDGLEFCNHPVQAECALKAHCRLTAHPWYIHFRYVNMDVNY